MTEPAFIIPLNVVKSFSATTQSEIFAYYGATAIPEGDRPLAPQPAAPFASPPVVAMAGDEVPAELTLALVRKLADRLSEKTLIALRIIAQSETRQFHLKDVVAATPGAKDYMDLRGVWSALTRRTRNILGDSKAELIWWVGDHIYEGDDYVDHIGEVAPLTHNSLRTFFNL
ncbi:hypothetical protein [Sphingomonas crocodyli]|uniref:Uncharacterized protein n=1 Tax=Sphingomonas crocodyli TaxID=1979270 RepID=A0A437M674_9SPHN|nr:hypothetical protein [Sphingomonas crocodyli]RVT93149.1 hypothetical protein EOD43_04455 [Sphingomonas crocodyli]